jgi:hypothetical protein
MRAIWGFIYLCPVQKRIYIVLLAVLAALSWSVDRAVVDVPLASGQVLTTDIGARTYSASFQAPYIPKAVRNKIRIKAWDDGIAVSIVPSVVSGVIYYYFIPVSICSGNSRLSSGISEHTSLRGPPLA